MKLKIGPIVVTAALSAALLFGGWFIYQYVGIEQPLDRMARQIDGVQSVDVQATGAEIKIELSLTPEAKISNVYREVKREGANLIGSKKILIQTKGVQDEELDDLWGYVLFDVAQAMENRQYTEIRAAMDRLMQSHDGLTALTEIDEDYVYVTLRKDEAVKYVVLPRQPAVLGVWDHA